MFEKRRHGHLVQTKQSKSNQIDVNWVKQWSIENNWNIARCSWRSIIGMYWALVEFLFGYILPTLQEMSNLFSIWCESMAIRPCRKVRGSWKRSEWSEWSDLFSSGASGSLFKAFWLAITSSHHIRSFSYPASCWFLLSTMPKPRLTDG